MIASLEIRLDCEATPGQAMRQAFGDGSSWPLS
jgi:hypothetical protein